MPRYQEEQLSKAYPNLQRNSVLTTFSIPETIMSDSLSTGPLENIVLSSERPIILQNPNYHAPRQDSAWKPWIPKLLVALFIVLGLALVLAVVLVILAVMGYLGKERVDVIDVVQPTATATATARALGNMAGGGVHMVVESSAGKTAKTVGILMAEVMLGWTLVYLFEKFEHREKKTESRGREKRRRNRSSGSGSSRSRSRSK
ncbi:hypothetical protein N431DRAFT_442201 [Stipitochalara longipes BDJ]|nr:hypothetical protein N431DRAFT_442201 [Stipitochalara longipes BDJ]